MQRSSTRILTTHTGSLPRPAALVQMVEGHDQREVRGYPAFASQVHAAVAEVVYEMGHSLLETGKQDEAVGYLERATQLAPQNPDIWYYLGKAQVLPQECAREGSKVRRPRAELQPAEHAEGPVPVARRQPCVAVAVRAVRHQVEDGRLRGVTVDLRPLR